MSADSDALARLDQRMGTVERDVGEVRDLMREMVRHNERLNGHEGRIKSLEARDQDREKEARQLRNRVVAGVLTAGLTAAAGLAWVGVSG